METREKNTKERILEEALKLFSQSGYMGTSMNDIAAELGVTKAALYKHYKSKQEILESIVERMNQMDAERAKKYEMPEGNMAEVIAEVIADIRTPHWIRSSSIQRYSFYIGQRKNFHVVSGKC